MGACMSRSAGGAVSTAESLDASGRGESTRATKARSYDSTSSRRIPIFGSGRVDCPVNRFFDHVQNNPLVLQLQEYRDGLLGPGETREETPELCTLRVSASTVPVPPMNIVIMIVGTRGDVHPFFGLGHLLQQDGHRVRIATHVEFEKEVKAEGFEFYPLGGDPRRLSAFMVETSGRLLPNLMNQSERAGLPEKMNMLNEIIQSTWPACTAPEPSDPKQTPFIADAIISNPVTYAHIHCAEALSVPLHLFFPQPWTPTHEFPHPFASMSYERGWCAENWYSYHMVDYLFHMGVSGYINDLRVNQMGLDPIRRGEHGFNLINNNHVPFVKMWSPNLVPKPKDWGPHIDVTGAFFTPPSKKAAAWEPPQDLVDFLAAGEPPIFVGFGSMVIDDVDLLLTAFLKAVEASGARMVLQSQWTAMIDARRHEAPPSVYPIGPAPHEWLLPRMGAVVHHGGAGTVAAGLRAGKPTLICPFFGDQFFWGQYVYERGVGPKPIPIRKVDAENLTAAFQELRAPEVKKRAEELAALMAEENGLVHGLHAFYRHLPVEDMVCEVSIFSSSTRIARCWCKECGLKMSWEADTAIHELSHDDNMRKHKREDYRFVNWGVLGPRNLLRGAREGIGGFAHELVAGVGDLITKPVEGFYREGATGVIKGAGHGAFNVVRRPIRGGIIFADKLATGGHNMIAMTGNAEGKQLIKSGHITRRYLFYDKIRNLEHMAGTKIFRQPDTVTAMNVSDRRLDIAKEEVDTALCLELRAAHACAMRARKTFDQLAPNRVMAKNDDVLGHFIQKTVNYSRQADIDVPSHLTPEWMSDVIEAMDTSGDGFISFPEFCMFLKALKAADEVAAHETKEEANRDLDLGVSLETRLQTIKCLVGFQAVHGCVFSMSKDASPPPSPRVPLTREPSAADAAATAGAEPYVTTASAAHSSYVPSHNVGGGGGGGDELSTVPAAALDDFKTAAPVNDDAAAAAAAAGGGGGGGGGGSASAGGDSIVEGFAAAKRGGAESAAALNGGSSEAFGAGASSYVTAVGAHSDIGLSDDSALQPAAAAAAAAASTRTGANADAVASAAAAAPADGGSSNGALAPAVRATSDDSVTGGFGSAGTGAAAAAAAAGAAAAAAHSHSFTAAVEAIARKSYTAGAAVGAAAAAAAVRASHMGGGGGGAEVDDRKPSIAAAAAAAAVAQQHGSYGGDVTGGTSDIAEAIAAATAAAHVWGDVRNSPAAAPP